tara:strand:- start:9856 stop:10908 length:1053 start_codon:yes stop_codon:yes gene_type:complete
VSIYHKPILTEDFNYVLPEQYIAQEPVEPRDSSKLMLVNKETGDIEHAIFSQLPELLNPNDLLVLNNSKVIPARLKGVKHGARANVEILLIKKLQNGYWHCLSRPGKRLRENDMIHLTNDIVTTTATIISTNNDGSKIISLEDETVAMEIGELPLPPYIKNNSHPTDRYQTIYSSDLGSVAAPTAGLHFTDNLLTKLKHRGIDSAFTTLHIGLDTFKPVVEEDAREHEIHTEFISADHLNISKINKALSENRRIICVGTTSVRVLEFLANKSSQKPIALTPFTGDDDLFILPGYEFKVVRGMITNFHLPKSTLLMMISSFATKSIILNAYEEAKAHNYRFYSYGDAMLIV